MLPVVDWITACRENCSVKMLGLGVFILAFSWSVSCESALISIALHAVYEPSFAVHILSIYKQSSSYSCPTSQLAIIAICIHKMSTPSIQKYSRVVKSLILLCMHKTDKSCISQLPSLAKPAHSSNMRRYNRVYNFHSQNQTWKPMPCHTTSNLIHKKKEKKRKDSTAHLSETGLGNNGRKPGPQHRTSQTSGH